MSLWSQHNMCTFARWQHPPNPDTGHSCVLRKVCVDVVPVEFDLYYNVYSTVYQTLTMYSTDWGTQSSSWCSIDTLTFCPVWTHDLKCNSISLLMAKPIIGFAIICDQITNLPDVQTRVRSIACICPEFPNSSGTICRKLAKPVACRSSPWQCSWWLSALHVMQAPNSVMLCTCTAVVPILKSMSTLYTLAAVLGKQLHFNLRISTLTLCIELIWHSSPRVLIETLLQRLSNSVWPETVQEEEANNKVTA